MPMTPKSPLKSAMKIPGTPGRRFENLLSPTFREEDILEAREKDTEAAQKKDVVCFFAQHKLRVITKHKHFRD